MKNNKLFLNLGGGLSLLVIFLGILGNLILPVVFTIFLLKNLSILTVILIFVLILLSSYFVGYLWGKKWEKKAE